MNIKNKAILLCGFSILLSTIPEVGYARWSSSSTSSGSRSYSPKSYSTSRSISRSSYSGFGSKSYQTTKITPPKSLGQTKTDNIFSRQSQKDQTVKDYSNWKNKNSPIASTVGNLPTSNSNFSSNTTKVVNKTYVTKNYNYGGHSYVMPSYYAPAYPSYGHLSSFFLGMLLAKATEPSYYNWAYAHYEDPSYIQWHREMEAQAQNNADLQSQLSMLDAKVEELKISNTNPKTLNMADPSMESAPEIKNVPITDTTNKNEDHGYFWKIVTTVGSLLLFVGIVVLILL